jgi:plasmid stabilization system protein ParE
MPKPVVFDPEAIAEARAAYSWYSARSHSAAASFLGELDDAVAAVEAAPDRWSPHVENTRRYVFRRFPFYLVYRELDDVVQVLAVAHGRRRPGYWRER